MVASEPHPFSVHVLRHLTRMSADFTCSFIRKKVLTAHDETEDAHVMVSLATTGADGASNRTSPMWNTHLVSNIGLSIGVVFA